LSELTAQMQERTKGYSFARYCKTLAMADGDLLLARVIGESTGDRRVNAVLRTAVDAGSTDPSSWPGGSLSEYTQMEREFTDLLRPASIAGRLEGARHVPLNIRFPVASSGASVAWVAPGGATPVSEPVLTSDALGTAQCAGIVAITRELAQSSKPSAVGVIRDELLRGVAAFLDRQMIDPGVAAASNTNPASLTSGATTTQSSGATAIQIAADLGAMLSTVSTAGAFRNPAFIMHTSLAVALASKMSTTGSPAFPDARIVGGSVFGVSIIASASVPSSVSAGSIVILLDASEVIIADEEPIIVDVSSEASLQMLSNPIDGAAQSISLFQSNLIGIRASALRNWKLAQAGAIAVLDNCHW
jgi:HK97 family phage major capsid protein